MPKFGREDCGRLDPDGRFAVWKNRKRKSYQLRPKRLDVYGEKSEEMRVLWAEDHADVTYDPYSGVERNMSNLCQQLAAEAARFAPKGLGSSKVFNSATGRSPRGSTGLTRHGKRLVRNGVAILEQAYGKDCMSFFTGTFPAMSDEDAASVVDNWAKGLNNFCKKVQRRLEKFKCCKLLVGCIEVQEKRRQRTGEHGLHLHMIFHGRRKGRSWALAPKQIQKIWEQSWKPYLTGVYDWNAATNIQRIVRSASAYLSKYMSKGLQNQALRSSETREEIPLVASWYVCSKSLRKWIETNTWRGFDCGEYIKQILAEHSRDVIFNNVVVKLLPSGSCVVVCGYGSTVYRNFNTVVNGSDMAKTMGY